MHWNSFYEMPPSCCENTMSAIPAYLEGRAEELALHHRPCEGCRRLHQAHAHRQWVRCIDLQMTSTASDSSAHRLNCAVAILGAHTPCCAARLISRRSCLR